jgi:UDP-2,3-diacylglucosamine hydrolase
MQTKIGKLAIIAGAGNYPLEIANYCEKSNIEYIILPIKGNFLESDYIQNKHIYPIEIGKVGKFLEILKNNNITDVILAGAVKKPSLNDIKVDFAGGKLLAKLLTKKMLGDNQLLTTVIKFIEQHGYIVRNTQEILPKILIEKGCLTKHKPSKQDFIDIDIACKVIQKIGELDIGQAVIVENKIIIAVEAIEGTDAMISRSAQLKISNDKSGILYKSIKPGQDSRVDLPTIGINTLKMAIKANLRGIALQADTSIILQQEEVISLANKEGLFIIGV